MNRAEHDAARRKWAEEMGLELRHQATVQHNFIDKLFIYLWPKGDGRRYDRDVNIIVFEDGSWVTSLDDGCINMEQSKRALHAMALAAETTKESA
jgi:hypothetical protein